jgi:hypothetical protein
MNRRFGWALLVAAGILLGFVSSSYQRTNAGTLSAPAADADTADADAVVQLKEIKAQLKEINTMLRTGAARVTVVINPSKS